MHQDFTCQGLSLIFFSRAPTATCERLSRWLIATILFASRRRVQRAAPSGGSLQASVTRCASMSPVIFGVLPGRGLS